MLTRCFQTICLLCVVSFLGRKSDRKLNSVPGIGARRCVILRVYTAACCMYQAHLCLFTRYFEVFISRYDTKYLCIFVLFLVLRRTGKKLLKNQSLRPVYIRPKTIPGGRFWKSNSSVIRSVLRIHSWRTARLTVWSRGSWGGLVLIGCSRLAR